MLLDGARRAVLRPMIDEGDRRGGGRVLAIERGPDLGRRQLLAGRVGDLLDDLAEFDLQQARQRQAVIALEQVRDAALAGLAVHADHRIVGAADIGGIDGQVGDVPFGIAPFQLPRRARRGPS